MTMTKCMQQSQLAAPQVAIGTDNNITAMVERNDRPLLVTRHCSPYLGVQNVAWT